MYDRPEYFVWIEIAGLLGLGALLLGPPAYLALSALGGGRGGVGGGGVAISSAGGPPVAARGFSSRGGGTTPVPGLSPGGGVPRGSATGPGRGGDVSVPFSGEWRSRAVPDLGGPSHSSAAGASGTGGGGTAGPSRGAPSRAGTVATGGRREGPPSGRGGAAGGFSRQGGPALANRPPVGARGPAASVRKSGRKWTEEVQEAARKGQRLAGEIGRLTRSSGDGATAQQSSSDPGSPEDPDRRNPGSPSNVPIDDHLHWLLVAGVLWGVWRLGRGG